MIREKNSSIILFSLVFTYLQFIFRSGQIEVKFIKNHHTIFFYYHGINELSIKAICGNFAFWKPTTNSVLQKTGICMVLYNAMTHDS